MNQIGRRNKIITPYINNLCAILIVLIVLGNFIDLCTDGSGIFQSLFLFIYSFHMPLLMFLAGSLSRETVKDNKRTFLGAGCMFFFYLSMKVVIWLVRMIMGTKPEFSLLSDSGVPWLFFTLGIYLLLVCLCKNANRKFMLIIAMVFALLCGYNTSIGDYLIASRSLVFLPAFLLGQMFDMERISSETGSKYKMIAGACILALVLLAMIVFRKQLYVLRPMFTGRNAYKSLGKGVRSKWLYRLAGYAVSFIMAWAVLAVTPRKAIGKWISRMGENFLTVYFWYRPVLYIFTGIHLFEKLEQFLGWRVGRAVWLLLGMVCVVILSSTIIEGFLKKSYSLVECAAVKIEKGIKTFRMFPINSWTKSYIWYTVAFLVTFVFSFLYFGVTGKTFIWNPDGNTFHIPGLMVYGDYLRNVVSGLLRGELNLSQYRFYIGFGMDPLLFALPSYAETINLISMFVPELYTEYLYVILTVVRIYLIGLSFLVYCFYLRKKPFSSCIAALTYAFCGFTIVAVKHPYFLTAMIYLPLLLIGVEDILRKSKMSIIFTVMVFISVTSSYYFLWMNTIFGVFYFLLRYPEVAEKNWRQFFGCLWAVIKSYLLGICMGAVYLVPNLLVFLNSTRQNTVLDPASWPFYSENYLKRLLGYLVVPWVSPGIWTVTGFSAICLICLFALFLRRKEHRALKIGYVIMLFSLAVPACALVMMAFTSVGNRWSFQLAFLSSLVVATVFDDISSMTQRNFIRIFVGICIYISYIALVPAVRNIYSLAGIILLLLTFICVYIVREMGLAKAHSQGLITAGIVLCAAVSSIISFSPNYGKYIGEFYSFEQFRDFLKESPYAAVIDRDESSFYRVDTNALTIEYRNSSIPLKRNTTNLTFNALDKYFFQYLSEMENADIMNGMVYDGLDNRAFLMSTSQVKYWSSKKEVYPIPYGYNQVEGGKDTDFAVYKNENFLPLGYTYDTVINEDDFAKMSSLEKQEALLQAVLLKDNAVSELKGDVTFTSSPVEFRVVSHDGISKKDDIYTIEKANAFIELEFPQKKNAEHYLRLQGMDISMNGAARWTITAKNEQEGFATSWRVDSPTHAIPHVTSNYTVNLGYTDSDALVTYKITFPSKGTFSLDSLEIYAQSMENYEAYLQELSEDTLQNVKIGLSQVQGDISLDNDKILFFSIPYSSGWKAIVDGQPVEILRANIAFMAIPLTAGFHEIVLNYTTPGLVPGIVISVISFLLFLYFILRRKPQFLLRLFHRQLFRFLLIGGVTTVIDFVIYSILGQIIHIVPAKLCSMLCSTFFAFLVNRNWTFGYREEGWLISLRKYYLAQAANITVNVSVNTLLFLAFQQRLIAFGAATLAGMTVNFLLQKNYVFKTKGE